MEAWGDFIAVQPRSFVKSCRKALQQLDRFEYQPAEPDSNAQAAPSREFVCYDFGHEANIEQSLLAHQYNKHGRINPFRYFVVGDHCRACLVKFSLSLCVAEHLQRSERCRELHFSFIEPRSHQEVLEISRSEADIREQLQKVGKAPSQPLHPAVRMCGPLRRFG